MPARLKLNLFSPLPPLRSEIGNHTLTVAAALSEMAEVTLWTPQTERPAVNADFPVEIIRYDPAAMDWRRLNHADAHIYNIGNNATFHRAIFDVARVAPGIVVLHDTRLQHFFARYSEGPGAGLAFYLDSIKRSHGLPAMLDAQRWLAGEKSLDTLVDCYPMTLAAMDQALAVIVHNEEEQQHLAAQTRTPVLHLPLAFAAGAVPNRPASQPNSTLRLIVFGFLGPNRRLDSIIDVIATLPDPDVRLDIYGALDDQRAVDDQIARLDLGARVCRHGFVSAAALQTALAEADLAINLRFPAMGEASASQLRIWDAALPSVVTRTGWYATLPADAVFFVEPEREQEMLRAHLAALRSDPTRFRKAGQRGRAQLETRHTPACYANGLLAVASEIDLLHARRAAIDLSRGAARVLLDLTDPKGVAHCIDPVAAAIAALTESRTILV